MLPQGLTEIFESANYVECDFRFMNLDLSTDYLKVEFVMIDTEWSNEKVNILMTISGQTDYFIEKDDNSSYSHLEIDHPLLWLFSDVQCELYISGRTEAAKNIIFDLFCIHYSKFQHYIPFNPNIITTLNNGNGLFIRGSKKLLKLYADKLNEYGIKTSIISESPPTGSMLNLKLLFLGNSYFIGQEFDFKIVDSQHRPNP